MTQLPSRDRYGKHILYEDRLREQLKVRLLYCRRNWRGATLARPWETNGRMMQQLARCISGRESSSSAANESSPLPPHIAAEFSGVYLLVWSVRTRHQLRMRAILDSKPPSLRYATHLGISDSMTWKEGLLYRGGEVAPNLNIVPYRSAAILKVGGPLVEISVLYVTSIVSFRIVCIICHKGRCDQMLSKIRNHRNWASSHFWPMSVNIAGSYADHNHRIIWFLYGMVAWNFGNNTTSID